MTLFKVCYEFLLPDLEVRRWVLNIGTIKCCDVFFKEVYQLCWCNAHKRVCITGMWNLCKLRYLFKELDVWLILLSIAQTFLNVFLMLSALLYNTDTVYFTEWCNAKISCIQQLKVFFFSSGFPLRNVWIAGICHQHQEEDFVVETFHCLASIRFWFNLIIHSHFRRKWYPNILSLFCFSVEKLVSGFITVKIHMKGKLGQCSEFWTCTEN